MINKIPISVDNRLNEARHISLLAVILSLNPNKIHENDCDVKLAKYIYDKAKEIVR